MKKRSKSIFYTISLCLLFFISCQYRGTNKTASIPTGISLEEYNKLVTSDKLILVDFNAPWCRPCKILAPILSETERDMNGKLKVVKINIDDNKELANSLVIESIPAMYVYKNGKLVWHQVGLIGKKELMEVLEKL